MKFLRRFRKSFDFHEKYSSLFEALSVSFVGNWVFSSKILLMNFISLRSQFPYFRWLFKFSNMLNSLLHIWQNFLLLVGWILLVSFWTEISWLLEFSWYERRYPTPETFLCSILYILYYISYLDSRTPQICCIPNSIGLPDHSVLFDIAYIVAVPGPTSIVYIIVLYNTHCGYDQLCPTSHKLLYVSK